MASYWFEDPMLRSLAPLALSTSIKGLTTIFNVPKMFVGANVFPSGVALGPSTIDTLSARCPRKRAFIVTDQFSKRFVTVFPRHRSRTSKNAARR